jgi:hypothetical protein
MASIRKNHDGEFHILRGRTADGSTFEYVSDIRQEPPGLIPGNPGYAAAKAELAKQALEEANDVEARSRKKMTEQEYESRAKHRAQKVLKQNLKESPASFIVAWLWEHVIRNRIDHTKALFLCNLVDHLLTEIGLACATIHDVRQEHFDAVQMEMRIDSYSPAVVNNAVNYLESLGRAIEAVTGNQVHAGLFKEAVDYDVRQPFLLNEILGIFGVLKEVVGALAVEWTIFLLIMLYTEMRPTDAKSLKREDIRLEEGVIRIISGKTENFRQKHVWRPMHRSLLQYLIAFLKDNPLRPEDPLCKHLFHMTESAISNTFNGVLAAAKIDKQQAKGENRIIEFSFKSLYSIKHTSYVWLDAAGARDEAKEDHCNSTLQAQRHYQHEGFEDTAVLEMRRKRINRMPEVPIVYEPLTAKTICDMK